MTTLPSFFSFALPCLLATGACATATPTPKLVEPHDVAPLVVDYRLTNRAADGALIVGGAMGLWGAHGGVFKHVTPHGDVELSFEALRMPGEEVMVLVHYKESSSEGARMEWAPVLVVKRNTETSAIVDSLGGGRELTLALR